MTIHPLEALSASEISTAVKLFREHHSDEQACAPPRRREVDALPSVESGSATPSASLR